MMYPLIRAYAHLCICIFVFFPAIACADPPDVAIRVSAGTFSALIESALPDKVALIKPAGGSFEVTNVAPDPVIANRLNVFGKLLESMQTRPLPVVANVRVDIVVKNQSVRLRPILTNAKILTKNIPWSEPTTLLKAWLWSSLAFEKPELQPISLPVQTQFELVSSRTNIRSRQSFGKAIAEVVASARTAANMLKLYVASASFDHRGLLIALRQEPHPAGDASVDWPTTTADPNLNTLFLRGPFLAKSLSRVVGRVSIPFHLENPRGWIDGHSSNTVFGRKEWYIEFQGRRPLSGRAEANTNFGWRNRLAFTSEISLRAQGKIHAHGDPGPGGGCGVRPNFSLDGRTTLTGYVDVAVNGTKKLAFRMRTSKQSQLPLHYQVDRVKICGVATKGPYRGTLHIAIPNNIAPTAVKFEPLIAKLPNGTRLVSRIVSLETEPNGYQVQFHAELKTP